MGSGAAVLAAGVGPLVPTGGEAAVAALWRPYRRMRLMAEAHP